MSNVFDQTMKDDSANIFEVGTLSVMPRDQV